MTISLPLLAAAVLSLTMAACSSGESSSSSSSGSSGAGADGGGGGGGGGGAVGSCTIAGGKTCFDYPGSGYTSASVQSSCSRITGVYSADGCPAAERVGSCEIYVGKETEQTIRYYTVGFTAERAKTNCTAQSGTFTAN